MRRVDDGRGGSGRGNKAIVQLAINGVSSQEQARRAAVVRYQLTSARHLLQSVADAGDAIAEHPVLTDSGQFDPLQRPLRPFSDVERERANELTHLPK
jgi:hypothetical protein